MNLKKEVTKTIVNEFDKGITHIEITAISEEDQAIFCNLYNGETMMTQGRVYPFDKFPCEVLNHGEKELIKGKEPTDKWNVPEIKMWLDSKQKKDDDGKVIKPGPYIYLPDDTKDKLLEKVKKDDFQ